MLALTRNLAQYHELIAALARKNVTLRYKQSYLGFAWAIMRPLMLMLVFALVRSLVGIETGEVPYALLSFSALTMWLFFQDACTDGVGSIVNHANLIRKIYFPREVFPLTSIVAKLVEFGIAFVLLIGLMAWFGVTPGAHALWVPLLVVYACLAALAVSFVGSAANVYARDISSAMPILFNLLMYASPVIYPLALVRDKLLVQRAAGEWSDALYTLYLANPMAGAIDAFQRVLLLNQAPDWSALAPGVLLTAVALPITYLLFKRAEAYFADVI